MLILQSNIAKSYVLIGRRHSLRPVGPTFVCTPQTQDQWKKYEKDYKQYKINMKKYKKDLERYLKELKKYEKQRERYYRNHPELMA